MPQQEIFKRDGVRFAKAGEFRSPKIGEYFLVGLRQVHECVLPLSGKYEILEQINPLTNVDYQKIAEAVDIIRNGLHRYIHLEFENGKARVYAVIGEPGTVRIDLTENGFPRLKEKTT